MADETRVVLISDEALGDLHRIFEYGADIFSPDSTEMFVQELLTKIDNLSNTYLFHTECRYLETKSQKYRTMSFYSYSTIYRITKIRIEVLAILHSSQSIAKIKNSRTIKIPG